MVHISALLRWFSWPNLKMDQECTALKSVWSRLVFFPPEPPLYCGSEQIPQA